MSQKGLQQLTVLSTPDGATVKLEGQPVGLTPWTGESFTGKHRIVLEAAGYQRSESVIEIDPHRARDFDTQLRKAPDPAALVRAAKKVGGTGRAENQHVHLGQPGDWDRPPGHGLDCSGRQRR